MGGGGGGGGLGDHDFLTIWPTSGCHGLGQKIVDHDHGQNFMVFVVKWSEILTMTMAKIRIFYGQRAVIKSFEKEMKRVNMTCSVYN